MVDDSATSLKAKSGIGDPTRVCLPEEATVIPYGQAKWHRAIGAVRLGTKAVDDLESCAGFTDFENHTLIMCAAQRSSAEEESVLALHQGAGGRVTIRKVSRRARTEGKQQGKLPAGGQFEDGASLKPLEYTGLCRAIDITVGGLD